MVTVIDKQLYLIYKMFNERIKGNETEDVIDFVTTAAERYDAEDLADTVDFGKLIKAIIDGESVELQEIKYRVPMPRIRADNGLQMYLYSFYEGGLGIYTLDSGTPSSFIFTMDEIPEEYRQWAEEVEE